MKNLLCILMLILSVPTLSRAETPCSPQAGDTGTSKTMSDLNVCSAPDTALINQLEKNGSVTINSPQAYSLSQAYVALGREPSGPTRQKALIRHIVQTLGQYLGSDTVRAMVKAQLGADLPPATPASTEVVTEKFFLAMKNPANRAKLDDFPVFTKDQLRRMQKEIANSSKRYTPVDPASVTAFPVAPGAAQTASLQDSGCTLAAFHPKPVFGDPSIVRGAVPMTDSVSNCVEQNSTALAEIFNQLSNTSSRAPLASGLTISAGAEKSQSLTNNSELLAALGKLGYTAEIYTTKAQVDFLGLGFIDANGYRPIKSTAYVQNSQGKPQVANHGEVNIILHKNGKIAAKLGWFFGIPDASHPGLATLWRPQVYKRAAWNEPVTENKRVYTPAQMQDAWPWLESAGDLMRGFRQVDQTFHVPANGYGLFICGDSLSMVLEHASRMSKNICNSALKTNVFPILRAGEMPIQAAGKSINISKIVTDQAGIDASLLAQDYPSDL